MFGSLANIRPALSGPGDDLSDRNVQDCELPDLVSEYRARE